MKKANSLKPWKRINDASIVPDRGFVKQLKKLKNSFDVVWDCISCNWEIWDFPQDSEPYCVTRVSAKNKSYKELSADILLGIRKSIFMQNNMTAKQICDYLDEADAQECRRKELDFRQRMKDIAWETFINIHCKVIQVPQKYAIERMVS
jgi:hypothetical protein